MKKSTFLLLVLLFSLLSLGGCKGAAGAQAEIRFELLDEVTVEQAAAVKSAAEVTRLYFAEAGRELPGPMLIVMTKDRPTYLRELQQRFNLSELQANRVAKGTDAMSGGQLIVMNIAGVPNERRKTFLTAHELTHYYQRAAGGVKYGEAKWLIEGFADVTAAQIVERKGYFKVAEYQRNWLEGLRSYGAKPEIGALRSREGWAESISRYGGDLTYKSAAVAVLVLTQRCGQEAVWQYFALLKAGRNAQAAFEEAFGFKMEEFEAEIDHLLARKKAA